MARRAMSRAGLIRLVSVGLWVALCGIGQRTSASQPVASAGSDDRPPVSVVLITLDTVRADHLGCYGYPQAETPALDALAREAVRFANAYAVAPITLPSHAVILTGTYPMWNGVRDFTSPGLPAGIPTLAEVMKRQGYATAAFVSAFVLNSMWGLNRGFDLYDDQMKLDPGSAGDPLLATRPGDVTTGHMLAWLDQHPQKRFFVWLHLYDAHSPYRAPEPYRVRHAGRPYDAAIAFDDAQVRRVLDALRREGLYDHTLVVVTSDHGESLGEHSEAEHGFFIYNATLRVPLIVKWPGHGEPGRMVAEPVSSIDIPSTIAQAAGIPQEEQRSFQGRPLSPSVGLNAPAPELVYAESYYARDSFGWHELRALVTRQFKYIDAPQPEIYDLEHDPSEQSNSLATHQAVAASLKASLDELARRFEKSGEPEAKIQLDPETVDRLRSLGYVAYQAGSVRSSTPTALADPKLEIGVFNDILRAGDLRRAGNYAQAAQLLSELRRQEPELYVVPFEGGENDLAWGKPREAIQEFRAALQLNPTFDQALLGLGRAYFQLGQDAEAATALELALHLNPRNFLARLALAKVYFHQNALEKAEVELARVVAGQPGFAEGRADYGVVLARRKKYAEAKTEIERGLELGYRDANTLNSLGIARGELGQLKAAIEAYQAALKLEPRFAAACLNLALVYRRLGESSEAQRYYRQVCALSNQLCRQYAAEFAPR